MRNPCIKCLIRAGCNTQCITWLLWLYKRMKLEKYSIVELSRIVNFIGPMKNNFLKNYNLQEAKFILKNDGKAELNLIAKE
jgi:hypothetical protein